MPSVSIVMGSDSDLERMAEAERVLKEFGVGVEVTIASAHRSPELVREYAQGLKARGVKVVIAAAGGAAHLAGVIASLTVLPVIGVPMGPTVPAGSAALGGFGGLGVMSGLDALLSTVQMPSGVPVACVAVNGAKNAALLAVRILALCDEDLEAKLMTYMHDQSEEVKRKAEQLRDLGVEGYLAKKARVRPHGPDETSPRH
ncbi:MAG TPA: AIR carboxylase family protein [Clostridia bacterium]|nr:AIR carboxylase family protein [Clostridia bacterium]